MVSPILSDILQNETGMTYESNMPNIVSSVHSLTPLKDFQSSARKKKCKPIKSLHYAQHIIEAVTPQVKRSIPAFVDLCRKVKLGRDS